MRFGKALQFAAVVASAVVAGLIGVQGTLALWTVSAPSNAGGIQAADFRLDLNGEVMPGGVAAATVVLGSPTTALTPSTPVYVPVAVKLSTDATAPFGMEAKLGEASIPETSPAALRRSLAVSYAAVPGGRCEEGEYGSTLSATLRKNEEPTRFCVRIALRGDAPLSIQRLGTRITVPLSFTQIGV